MFPCQLRGQTDCRGSLEYSCIWGKSETRLPKKSERTIGVPSPSSPGEGGPRRFPQLPGPSWLVSFVFLFLNQEALVLLGCLAILSCEPLLLITLSYPRRVCLLGRPTVSVESKGGSFCFKIIKA